MLRHPGSLLTDRNLVRLLADRDLAHLLQRVWCVLGLRWILDGVVAGIDALLVDEAHAFKSLPVYSRRSEIKGVPSTRSDRATSMYMRTRWLMDQNNNKGVVFATGTPVTNTLAEVYNLQRYLQPELLEERGIENVMIMGVHTNMCVLGRPFGLRNMARYGKNVVLVRDLTDTMYNPKKRPYVSHDKGTELVVEHIEKHWCPSVLSSELAK